MASESFQNAKKLMNKNYDTEPFPTHAAIVAYWFQRTDEIKVNIAAACPKCWACGQDWNERFWSKQPTPLSRTFTHWERAPLQRCHIISRKLGGKNETANLFLMCNECHDLAPNTTDRPLFFAWAKRQDYLKRREKRLREAFEDFGLDSDDVSFLKAFFETLRSPAFKSWIGDNTLCHWPQDKKRGSRLTEATIVAAYIAFRKIHSRFAEKGDNQERGLRDGASEMAAILAEIAKDEKHSQRKRQTAQFAAMRATRANRGKYAPFGWESEPQEKRLGNCGPSRKLLVPHAGEQAVLRRIFELIGRRQSTSQVAKFLNSQGMKPKGKPRYLPGGQPVESKGIWYAATVQSVLEHSTLVDGTYCEVTNEGRRLSFHVVRPSHAGSYRAKAPLSKTGVV
jgi:recombinase/HNH endonuclease